MRNRALHDALRDFALEAAALLTEDLKAGAEVEFDVVDEGGGRGGRDVPLALPPGPANAAPQPDAIDAELWSIIDRERVRLRVEAGGQGADRIAAHAASRPAARTLDGGEA